MIWEFKGDESDVTIEIWRREGRYPVQYESSIPLFQQDTQQLKQVPEVIVLLLIFDQIVLGCIIIIVIAKLVQF